MIYSVHLKAPLLSLKEGSYEKGRKTRSHEISQDGSYG